MALRAVIDHPKFSRLKQILRLNKPCTLGNLEALWHFCGRYTPTGAIGKYSNADIEAWLEWDGPADQLVEALVAARWIDEHPEHRLVVHDWPHHADDLVHTELARRCQPFADGQLPRTGRLNKDERKRFFTAFPPELSSFQSDSLTETPAEGQTDPASSQTKSAKAQSFPASVTKPEPVPEPEPGLQPENKTLPSDERSAAEGPVTRHTACKAHVHAYWHHRHPAEQFATWDGSEAKALDRLLKAKPDLTPDRFRQLLACRERSDVNHNERPRAWIERLTDYGGGPLDRFKLPAASSRPEAIVGMHVTTAEALPARASGPTPKYPPLEDQVRASTLRNANTHRELTGDEKAFLAEFDRQKQAFADHVNPPALQAVSA